MSPEEYLAFIEGTASLCDAVTHIRDSLVEKGWTPGGAEMASTSVFGAMMANAGPQTGRKR